MNKKSFIILFLKAMFSLLFKMTILAVDVVLLHKIKDLRNISSYLPLGLYLPHV